MISKDSVVCQDSASFIKHDSQWRNQTCVVFLILEALKLGLLFFNLRNLEIWLKSKDCTVY